MHGQLLAVGEQDSDDTATDKIYLYNTKRDSWDVISHMPTPRCWWLVAVLPGNKLMVVGGEIDIDTLDLEYTNKVEILVVV